MRKIWYGIIVVALIFILKGCVVREWEERHVNYHAPNWTSDGKIIFFEEIWIQKLRESISGPEIIEETQSLTLYEVDNNGTNYAEIEEVSSSARGFFSMVGSSSAGDYVVFGLSNIGNNENEIWVIGRDGTGLREVGEGRYPDFSPDASQIVYEKPNQGIWIMNRDGGNDHQIISDTDAQSPSWSSLKDTLVYCYADTLFLVNKLGAVLSDYYIGDRNGSPDWSLSSDTVSLGNGLDWKPRLLSISTGILDTLTVIVGGFVRWAPERNKFIGHDENGYFVINRNGTNKWYLEP